MAKKCWVLDLVGEEVQVLVDVLLFDSVEIARVSAVATSKMMVLAVDSRAWTLGFLELKLEADGWIHYCQWSTVLLDSGVASRRGFCRR